MPLSNSWPTRNFIMFVLSQPFTSTRSSGGGGVDINADTERGDEWEKVSSGFTGG